MYNTLATKSEIMMTLPVLGMLLLFMTTQTLCVKVRWRNVCNNAVSGESFRWLTYCLQSGWWRTGNGVISLPLALGLYIFTLSFSLSFCHTLISACVLKSETVHSSLPLAKLQHLGIVTHRVHLPDEQSHHCASSNYSNPANKIHSVCVCV